MDTIEIEVPVSFVERGIDQMKQDVEALEEVLATLEENGLDENDGYWKLDAKKADLQAGVDQMERKLENHTKGLDDLFS